MQFCYFIKMQAVILSILQSMGSAVLGLLISEASNGINMNCTKILSPLGKSVDDSSSSMSFGTPHKK